MAGDAIDVAVEIASKYDSSGSDAAKRGVNSVVNSANEGKKATEGLGNQTEKTGKQASGAGERVGQLSSVILRSIGFQQQAEVAGRLAASGYKAMGDAAQLLNVRLAAITLGVSFLLPKLIEWIRESGEAKIKQDQLTDSVIGQLPQLDDLATKLGKVNEALRIQAETVKKQALDQQVDDIAKYTKQIVDLQQKASDLQITIERVGFGLEKAAPDSGTSRKVAGYREELRKLTDEIDRQSAILQELMDAQEQGTTVERMRTGQTRAREKAEEEARRATEKRRREEERLKKLQDDSTRGAFALQSQKAKEEAEKKKQHQAGIERAAKGVLAARMEQGALLKEAQEAVKIKRQQSADLVAIGAGTLSQFAGLFGKNKSLNIAAAVADTYAAANKAFNAGGGWPMGVAMMLATIVQGMANVASIRKTSPGFDDPVNDLLAQKLGRRFAMDALGNIMTGWRGGLKDLASLSTGGPVTQHTMIDRGMHVGNVNLGGFFGTNPMQMKKRVYRDLVIRQARFEKRTTL